MTTEHQQAEMETAANIKRYDREEGGMFPSESGDWVLYEDYSEQMAASMKVPPGMALVPIEPTKAMVLTFYSAILEHGKRDLKPTWRALLEVASQDSAKGTK